MQTSADFGRRFLSGITFSLKRKLLTERFNFDAIVDSEFRICIPS